MIISQKGREYIKNLLTKPNHLGVVGSLFMYHPELFLAEKLTILDLKEADVLYVILT